MGRDMRRSEFKLSCPLLAALACLGAAGFQAGAKHPPARDQLMLTCGEVLT